MPDSKKAEKTVKVKPVSTDLIVVEADDTIIKLWGVPFTVKRDEKGDVENIYANLSEEDAAPMIECGRVAKVK